MISAHTPIDTLPTIKKTFLPKCAALGIHTVRDLLFHIPSRYEDFSEIKKIATALEGEKATFEGVLSPFREKKTWKRRMTIFEADITDDSGATLYQIWLYGVDSGALFKNGSTELLGTLCQFGWDDCEVDDLPDLLEQAQAEIKKIDAKALLCRFDFAELTVM